MDEAPPPTNTIQEGVRLFNEGYFFEAHDVLEDAWRVEHGEPRLFLQGLIQVCAGFHHFQNGNLSGALALLERGADKMRRYPARYMGFDAATLIAQIVEAQARIRNIQDGSESLASLEFPKIEIGRSTT